VQALRLDPNNDFTHTAQGWRLLQMNDRKAARAQFLEALRINPLNYWAQSWLASTKAWAVHNSVLFLVLIVNALRCVASGAPAEDQAAVLLVSAALVIGLIAVAADLLWIRDSLRNAAK
jgi:hypothetical protein